jgi:RNA polymerase sigma-70 factor (ECF subfamily)
MSEETTYARVQGLVDRLRAGDVRAGDGLLELCRGRLVVLTRRMLDDYGRLRSFEETDDVFQNAAIRLHKALATVKPATAREFFGFAALQIRRELRDLVRHHFGRAGHAFGGPAPPRGGDTLPPERSQWTYEPSRIAMWGDFHDKVEALPDEEREVVELLWYQDLPQHEAAEVLGVDPSTVKRRWRAARLKLAAVLGDG